MKKRHFLTLILCAIVVVGIYKYIYQGHRNIESEKATFVVSSIQLSNEFNKNTTVAQSKYLNKTIEVTGITSEITQNTITLNDKVFCQFLEQLKQLNTNEYLKIKGRVIGYDDLLEEVKLDQCHIIK